ncbi:hypothetical protein [Streptomyces cyaneofuscatus]|uniref:hypothetical protein n=1 Tax=Streptomyces cyaneofuscatus TaxID=66883 RepID=UPI0037B3E2C9
MITCHVVTPRQGATTWGNRNIHNGSRSTADEPVISETNHGIAFLVPGMWNYEFCMTAVNGAPESGKSNCVVAPRPAGS